MNEWKWHSKIVTAILVGDDVAETVRKLVKAKRAEVDDFESDLKAQAENSKLLTAGLRMPEESAGWRMATAILEEMRENYPEAAKAADERIANRKAAEEAELNYILRR